MAKQILLRSFTDYILTESEMRFGTIKDHKMKKKKKKISGNIIFVHLSHACFRGSGGMVGKSNWVVAGRGGM